MAPLEYRRAARPVAPVYRRSGPAIPCRTRNSEGLTRLEALAVSSRLSPLKPLGGYRLDVEGGDNARMNLSTLNGDLQLVVKAGGSDRVCISMAKLLPAPSREAALSNLLNILGRRQGTRSIITFG